MLATVPCIIKETSTDIEDQLRDMATGLTVGGWFVSALLDNLVDKISTYAIQQHGFHSSLHNDLKKLWISLIKVQAVIVSAEKKQLKEEEGVLELLKLLKEAAYDADDLLSESEYEQLKLKVEGGENQESSFFMGFTRLCKGLAIVLVAVYVLLQFFPSAVTYLALIPARTIPFAWNLITAGYLEQSLPGVAISMLGLLFFGRLLEPLWGPREFLKFIIVVNFLTSICVFVTAIGLYYATREESYLYTPLSGFHGVLSGFLVGIKQITPDDELSLVKIKVKWLPTLFVLVSVAVSFFLEGSASYVPTIIFGIYMSWIYLRYFQKKPVTGLKGDPSDEFSFSSFFPEFLRPILDPIASMFHRALCGRSETSGGSGGQILDGSHLPGSDPIEALRRRERGARALEQRLTAEKLSTTGSGEGVQHEDAADNV